MIRSLGSTRGRRYEVLAEQQSKQVSLIPAPQEDVLWREWLAPEIEEVPANVRDILHHGFTEMVNNAVDHSGGTQLVLDLVKSPLRVEVSVSDNGIGIFKKIKEAFHLDDEKQAVLELSKGKLTTDPARHTGEGIFFTSRMFDTFSILSSTLFLVHLSSAESDWLLENADSTTGTLVSMELDTETRRTTRQVFDRFTSEGEGDYGFDITRVPVALAKYGDENLISRSQAKRLLARFDRFRRVVLDFTNVSAIGQSFADEVFRVFALQHPEVHLQPQNANADVTRMISRARAALLESNPPSTEGHGA